MTTADDVKTGMTVSQAWRKGAIPVPPPASDARPGTPEEQRAAADAFFGHMLFGPNYSPAVPDRAEAKSAT